MIKNRFIDISRAALVHRPVRAGGFFWVPWFFEAAETLEAFCRFAFDALFERSPRAARRGSAEALVCLLFFWREDFALPPVMPVFAVLFPAD